MNINNWGKISALVIISILLSGCSSSSDTQEVPQNEATLTELNACNSMQEIVWTLDNAPIDAVDSIVEQETFLDYPADRGVPVVEGVLDYSTKLKELIESNADFPTLLDVLRNQSQVGFEDDQLFHEDMAEYCDSIGFTIYDDSFLGTSWEPVTETESATPSPEPTTDSSSGNSEKCFDSMKRASLESNSTIAEKFLKETAEYCAGKTEWYMALRMYPYAMGFSDVMGNELDILCYNYPRATACTNP